MVACRYVKTNTNLPNLTFVKDDARNIAGYGQFDVIFCCGLLYHLDRPKEFLRLLSSVCRKLLIVQTHFSVGPTAAERLPRFLQSVIPAFLKHENRHGLSPITENESLKGRWYVEFANDSAYSQRETKKWASLDNRRSFWIQREYLLQAVLDVGFDIVMEQFDGMQPDIAGTMTRGYYKIENRGTFIGIKTDH